MKAIIPAAGRGTRLFPHTHTKPKAMVRLAGRPILGHILASVADTRIQEVVVVVGGPMQDQIVDYADRAFGDRFTFTFVEQEDPEGLGHSIYQAERVARGDEALIALGDMLFENGYRTFLEANGALSGADGSIGVKQVDEPGHYGVVKLDGDRIVRLVEKPEDPPSDLAISGVYVVDDTDSLFDALTHIVENDLRGAGDEYQLTDALQRMIDEGADLRTFGVEDWYDCGRPETLLEANRVLLSNIETETGAPTDTVVIPPVDFGEGVDLAASVVGPNVSVDDDATIEDSIVRDSIVGRNSTLEGVNLEGSIVGDNAEVHGEANHLNVGDNSRIDL